MKYRKKPAVVEARRLTINNMATLANWCDGSVLTLKPRVEVPTLHGVAVAHIGDWIIRGEAGDFWPCKPRIFEATYEEAA